MSKQNSSGRTNATGQLALTHRQRRRPRGEVNRQPPRVRTRTHLAVQSLDGTRPAIPDDPIEERVGAVEPATALSGDSRSSDSLAAPLEPPDAVDAMSPEGAPPPFDQSVADAATPDASHADASQSAPRLPRRTRTLADVVQPRRDPAMSSGSFSTPSMARPLDGATTAPLSDPAPLLPASPAAEPAVSADLPVEPATTEPGTSEAETAAAIPPAGASPTSMDDPASDPDDGVPPATDAMYAMDAVDAIDTVGAVDPPAPPPPTSIPVPTRARVRRETAPIAATTGLDRDRRGGPRAGDPWGANPNAIKDDDEIPARFMRAARRGLAALAWRMAQGHAVAGMVLAVVASGLVLLAQPVGVWLLALAAVALAGGGLAALLLLWWRRASRLALVVLALAQMGALAWVCVLVGPRAALLVLAAPAVALALRAGGRWVALFWGTGLAAVYIAFQIAASQAFQPVFTLPPLALAAGDAVAVVLGLGLLLAELVIAAAIRTRSEAAARARLYEIRLLRERIAVLRRELEEDGERLDAALAQALRGRGMDPIAVDGPLSQIATSINAAAERLRTLQRDREDRLRVESAVRALARALERGWLGMPWTWPEPSGTLLDEVVMLMRTPRPADSLAAAQFERRASPHSGPLAQVSTQFDVVGPERSLSSSGRFGLDHFGMDAGWRE